ncbi:hypothetical protein Mmc1_0645 [Magnetococcus marinus MC-1]|uniref:Uncharacterized protein n=1 Tax=Magnetococcus marinus (strain ATCC BAA-1437 / JCM 17883 / MC-1) TaxID=156889 RepID=A0L5C3_MAGMM|nr:hypothetical protein [Magnetococcus marinus]ABK43166.1 hypothetical protein Mmc1_0645 [Magnetococcus marinus MC-1]
MMDYVAKLFANKSPNQQQVGGFLLHYVMMSFYFGVILLLFTLLLLLQIEAHVIDRVISVPILFFGLGQFLFTPFVVKALAERDLPNATRGLQKAAGTLVVFNILVIALKLELIG